MLPPRILFRWRPVKSDRLLLTDISCNSITIDSWTAITFVTSLFREGWFNPSFLIIMPASRTGVEKIMLTLVIPAFACPELSFFSFRVVWLKCLSKTDARACSLFIFIFKAISFFWADDLLSFGTFPAARRSAVTSAANYCAADECSLRNFIFTTRVSLEQINNHTGWGCI